MKKSKRSSEVVRNGIAAGTGSAMAKLLKAASASANKAAEKQIHGCTATQGDST